MSDTTYNGWTNYATWRVKLEIFDNIPINEFEGVDNADPDIYSISQELKHLAEYYIECECPKDGSFARDYALAFLADVNWYEIADHLVKEYIEENQE
jgi:hypothetical protein